ncbi:MAG TPA: hypothetical protein VF212_07700 [Longimicrobiales bacterium]
MAMHSVRSPIRAAIAALLILVPTAAHAQDAAAEPPVLLPGDEAVDGRRIAPGTTELRLLVSQNGQVQQLATITEQIREVEVEGRAALERVQIVRMPMGVATDTVVVLRETLAPVRHRSHNPQRVMALDFAGAKITGTITPASGAVQPIDVELDGPVFDSNPLDLVVRALPLAEGYAVSIPLYLHEAGGKFQVVARVTGSEAVDLGDGATEDAWVVDVEAAGQSSRFWISKTSREMLRQGSSPAPGVELEIVR